MPYVVFKPVRTDIIENVTEKFDIALPPNEEFQPQNAKKIEENIELNKEIEEME